MLKVRVEILPGFSEQFRPEQQGRLIWEERMGENETLKGLLRALALTRETFGEVVFDPRCQQLYPGVWIAINGRLLTPLQKLDVKLRDGDRVEFIPAFAGG